MEVSIKVCCLPSAVGKNPSNSCLHTRIPGNSYLCEMSGSRTINSDDDDDD